MRKKILYGVIIIASLLALGASSFERMSIEKASKAYEIVLDFQETKLLAEQAGSTHEHWLSKFGQWGASSVALDEDSFASLIEQDHRPIKTRLVDSIMKDYALLELYQPTVQDYLKSDQVDAYDLIVQTPSKSDSDRILEGLKSRYSDDFYKYFEENGDHVFIINGTPEDALYTTQTPVYDSYSNVRERQSILAGSKLEQIGLGFNPEKIALIKKSGLQVMPRPRNYTPDPDKLVDAYFNDLKKYDMKPDYIIFSGSSIVGYEDGQKNMQHLIDLMRSNKIAVGMVETGVQRQYVEQDGIDVLAQHMEYDAVRVFPVVKYIQQRYKYYNYSGAEEIENTIYRAVSERNIRSVYFRPFLLNDSKYVTDEAAYETMFNGVSKRLQAHGYVMGKVGHFAFNEPSILQTALLATGVVAVGMICLKLLFPMLPTMIELIMLIGGALACFPMAYVAPNLTLTGFSLLASILFPTLSIILFMSYARQKLSARAVTKTTAIVGEAAVLLVACATIAMMGGLYVANILSHSRYLIEMEIFRGVKLSQVAPLGLFFIIYLLKFGYRRNNEELQGEKLFHMDILRILDENIKVLYVFAAGAVAVVGIIYIARTGHETSIQPSTLEMIFRNYLENHMLARPRTKEFMMAFPALMGLAYISHRGYRKLILPAGLLATIGFASVANTFSHLRTPLYLSLYRTAASVVLGMLLGVLAILVFQVVENIYNNLRGKRIHE